MNALSWITALAVALIPATTTAQYAYEGADGPTPYPGYFPTAPQSALGEFRRQQTNRRFWEGWDAQYRLDKAQLALQLRQVRALEVQIKQQARQERLNESRAANEARALYRQQRTADQAAGLLNAIRSGAVRWPEALQRPAARIRLNEAAAILRQAEPRYGDSLRLQEIAQELGRHVQRDATESSYAERLRAHQVVQCLGYLAAQPDLTLARR